MSFATELKALLLDGLAAGKELQLDLESVGEIDITTMQLLSAAGREAERKGMPITMQLSEKVRIVARAAGFERFPGSPTQA